VKNVISGFAEPLNLSHGAYFGPQSYHALVVGDERTIVLCTTNGGLCAVKTKTAVLIGTYTRDHQPGRCRYAVEKLADYLIENGF